MSCLRLCSRAGVPRAPRKYFVVTMVEALTLQKSGNSTPFCSKTTSPVFQLVCTTSRRSQVTSSYGCSPDVKTRSMVSPAGFGVELALSDRPFAERVVSVISAFLVCYRRHHAPMDWGMLRHLKVVSRQPDAARSLLRWPDASAVSGWFRSLPSWRQPVRHKGAHLVVSCPIGDERLDPGRFLLDAKQRDLRLEILHRPELAIHACEAEVRNLVKLAQRSQDRHSDLIGRNLGLTKGP